MSGFNRKKELTNKGWIVDMMVPAEMPDSWYLPEPGHAGMQFSSTE